MPVGPIAVVVCIGESAAIVAIGLTFIIGCAEFIWTTAGDGGATFANGFACIIAGEGGGAIATCG